MIRLLHPAGRRSAGEAAAAAAALGRALGEEAAAQPFGPGQREGALRGALPEGAWALLPGPDCVRVPAFPAARLVVLPRRDPRWSLEDMAGRPLEALPPGTRVIVASELGAFLLLRARPDLRPVRAGAFPAPEETPVLAEGPYDGRAAGRPLLAAAFVPAPGTGIAALLAPAAGALAPPAARALEDEEARVCLAIERGLVAGAGELPAGAALGGSAKRKVSILFALRAVLFVPGSTPRTLEADIPLANAGAFARGFGAHLREPKT